jgi:hypothetical protein
MKHHLMFSILGFISIFIVEAQSAPRYASGPKIAIRPSAVVSRHAARAAASHQIVGAKIASGNSAPESTPAVNAK